MKCVCGIDEYDCLRQQARAQSNEPCADRLELRNRLHTIKMTSTRTGDVAWIREDGTPSKYESEAGRFTEEEADMVIAEYRQTLERVVGRCANRFALIEVPS